MKSTKTLLVAALAAGSLVMAADASADRGGGHWSGGSHGGSHWSGGHSGHWSGGHSGHWAGGHSGHWSGGHYGHWSGGHWRGRGGYWGPSWGFYLGVPLFWPSYYWGTPYYYDDYWYPRETILYSDVAPAPYEEVAPPTTQVPSGTAVPSRGPLYMNYCESARAYFPKVTSCPEGWKFIAPN